MRRPEKKMLLRKLIVAKSPKKLVILTMRKNYTDSSLVHRITKKPTLTSGSRKLILKKGRKNLKTLKETLTSTTFIN